MILRNVFSLGTCLVITATVYPSQIHAQPPEDCVLDETQVRAVYDRGTTEIQGVPFRQAACDGVRQSSASRPSSFRRYYERQATAGILVFDIPGVFGSVVDPNPAGNPVIHIYASKLFDRRNGSQRIKDLYKGLNVEIETGPQERSVLQ